MRADLGDDYTDRLRQCYEGRVPGEADLVTYWFEKARAQLASGQAIATGLVATNSIRQTGSRPILERIAASGRIFHAWSDEPWINEGANVRVSIICFDANPPSGTAVLDGQPVSAINADLTDGASTKPDLTKAKKLAANAGKSFFGLLLAGKFAVKEDVAQGWLQEANPNGRPNSDVVRPIRNGNDILKTPSKRWVIDFGTDMTEAEASLYAAPFAHIEENVKPDRLNNNRASRAKYWWRLGETRPGMRRVLDPIQRYIATVETAKHRIFVMLDKVVAPEHSLIVIARDDYATFGILSSRIHVVWALAQGGTLEDRPRYNSTQCFDTFPFPKGMEPDQPASSYGNSPVAMAIAEAAKDLDDKRQNVLKAGQATLTRLYNERPTWLKEAHARLDTAVAAAYGWADWNQDLSDDEILNRLLAENLHRKPVAP
jgi:type II restriction/modification system DNA methylase subunit YeeA